jgi:hypothetical protein
MGLRDPGRDRGLIVFLLALFCAFVAALFRCLTEP